MFRIQHDVHGNETTVLQCLELALVLSNPLLFQRTTNMLRSAPLQKGVFDSVSLLTTLALVNVRYLFTSWRHFHCLWPGSKVEIRSDLCSVSSSICLHYTWEEFV